MNKHFSDARYYLGRAATHLKIGLSEELRPVARRVRAKLGDEVEEAPEPATRAERVRHAAKRSTHRVKQAVGRRRAPDEQTA